MTQDEDIPPSRFAIVYAPGRVRQRVPEHCVSIVEDEAAARAAADPAHGMRAAEVLGPMRSSEGLRVFFVRRWL